MMEFLQNAMIVTKRIREEPRDCLKDDHCEIVLQLKNVEVHDFIEVDMTEDKDVLEFSTEQSDVKMHSKYQTASRINQSQLLKDTGPFIIMSIIQMQELKYCTGGTILSTSIVTIHVPSTLAGPSTCTLYLGHTIHIDHTYYIGLCCGHEQQLSATSLLRNIWDLNYVKTC